MPASELASRLNAKSMGKGYMTNCPCHDDKNPSLQFFDSMYNGSPYIHFFCYTGCSHQNIKEYYQSVGVLEKPKSYVKVVYKTPTPSKETTQDIKKVEQKDYTDLYLYFLDAFRQ